MTTVNVDCFLIVSMIFIYLYISFHPIYHRIHPSPIYVFPVYICFFPCFLLMCIFPLYMSFPSMYPLYILLFCVSLSHLFASSKYVSLSTFSLYVSFPHLYLSFRAPSTFVSIICILLLFVLIIKESRLNLKLSQKIKIRKKNLLIIMYTFISFLDL